MVLVLYSVHAFLHVAVFHTLEYYLGLGKYSKMLLLLVILHIERSNFLN